MGETITIHVFGFLEQLDSERLKSLRILPDTETIIVKHQTKGDRGLSLIVEVGDRDLLHQIHAGDIIDKIDCAVSAACSINLIAGPLYV